MKPNNNTTTERNCSICQLLFNASFFIEVRKSGKKHKSYRNQCNQCRNKANLNRRHLMGYPKKNNTFHLTVEERRQRINAVNKKWREDNPQKWKAANRLNRHRRRALGSINSTEWIAKVMMLENKCQICFKTEPEIKITIDHIIPISKGGTNDINNLQPLCMYCNQTKHAKILPNDVRSIALTT